MITGNTTLVAHLGYPTMTFKSPRLYNSWFAAAGVDAVIVPMGARAEGYPEIFRAVFQLTNLRGALVTMPHKVTTLELVDELTSTARVAGATNVVLRREDGTLIGDQFDGAGFTNAISAKGFVARGKRALIVGSGGVGSAIAASLAQEGIRELVLYDAHRESSERLAARVADNFPAVKVELGDTSPEGCDLVVNATPLGTYPTDPLPVNVNALEPGCLVGDVSLKADMTPLLKAAQQRGCQIQVGTDMVFAMAPSVLDFLGFPSADASLLRSHYMAAEG
ncbi:shikimate dehydrogenase [Luteococcus sp. H138]